eukprot:8764698-Alexandrium_andersonii.AAC.1
MISRITDCRITDKRIANCCAHCVFPGVLCTPGPPWKAPPARPPACFAVTIGFSAQHDAESPGRGLGG